MRIAFELYALSEAMLRQNWRRRHPGASADEIEDVVTAWLANRPGAEHGDCEGHRITWPRSR